MISQRCPKCRSSRIRRGYKPTPLLLRMVGIYNLLCDHCNLLFTGFALPGTVRKRSRSPVPHQFNNADNATEQNPH